VAELGRRCGASVATLVRELPEALLEPGHSDDDVCLLAFAYREPAARPVGSGPG
jgi:hypothetical protein